MIKAGFIKTDFHLISNLNHNIIIVIMTSIREIKVDDDNKKTETSNLKCNIATL